MFNQTNNRGPCHILFRNLLYDRLVVDHIDPRWYRLLLSQDFTRTGGFKPIWLLV